MSRGQEVAREGIQEIKPFFPAAKSYSDVGGAAAAALIPFLRIFQSCTQGPCSGWEASFPFDIELVPQEAQEEVYGQTHGAKKEAPPLADIQWPSR